MIFSKNAILQALTIAIGTGAFFYLGSIFLWPDSEKEIKYEKLHTDIKVKLVDPEMAPPDIKPMVMLGLKLIEQTNKYLPDNVGNLLCCSNCHFAAGNTLGGPGNGIALVGVNQRYPVVKPGKKDVTLKDRINGCFLRSMNGKPLDEDSKEINAMVTYLNWISTPAEKIDPKWLGLPPLQSDHIANSHNGKVLYMQHCALCHGDNGEGQQRKEDLSYPPLWGENSFNSAAGMHKFRILSSFIYCNMPFQDPFLTVEESMDIAAYVITRPRPSLALHQPTAK